MDILVTEIKNVKFNPNNPRTISEDKFNKLVKSIEELPDMLFKRPLIAYTDKDDKFVVLGGNMRLKALNHLGYDKVPIILADTWTEEQKQQFLIKDNIGYGEWNWDALANEFSHLELEEMGLDIPNFMGESVELDDFFNEEPEEKNNPTSIVLNYTETEHAEVIEMFASKSGSREQIVFELLKNSSK